MSSFHRILKRGPVEAALEELWTTVQAKPVQKLRHIPRIFRFKREFKLLSTEKENWSRSFPSSRIPDCQLCTENCCQGPKSTVLLRLSDIALFIDKGWTEHITLQKPIFSQAQLVESPALKEMVHSFHWQVFPVLKQDAFGKCLFLQEEKCTIHPFRPWICRRFPYSLDIETETVHWADRCKTYSEGTTSTIPDGMLSDAINNFYIEKSKDLLLTKVYPEALEELGLSRFLNHKTTESS